VNDARKKTETNTFHSTVAKVQTLVDGGIRVTFDLPETEIESAAWLMNCKRIEQPLIVIVRIDTEQKDPVEKLLEMKD